MSIALVDYGAGNLTSVRKAFHYLGADIFTPQSPAELERAMAVVVPGVGHFAATRSLTPEWHAAIHKGLDDRKAAAGDLRRDAVAVRRQCRSARQPEGWASSRADVSA